MKKLIFILVAIFSLPLVYSQEETAKQIKYRFIGEIAPNLILADSENQFTADFNFINSMEFPSKNTLGIGIGANYDFVDFVHVPVFVDIRIKLGKDNAITPLLVFDGGVIVFDSNSTFKTHSFYKIGFGLESKATKKPVQLYIGYKRASKDVYDGYIDGVWSAMKKKKGSISDFNLNLAMIF